jgi:hypothetical protein
MKKLQFVNPEEIKKLREQLGNMTTGWTEDGCVPPNLVIKDGLGNKIAEVNRWCGGFQSAHCPMMIGWKAQIGSQSMDGAILVAHADCSCSKAKKETAIDHAIEEAKDLAERSLKQLKIDLDRE